MSWMLFLDESGHDRRESPYEVLAGLAVEDRVLWRLIQALRSAQDDNFGIRLFDAYGVEAKGHTPGGYATWGFCVIENLKAADGG